MAIDNTGITYVATAPYVNVASTVSAIANDGSIVYKAQFTSSVAFLAPAKGGKVWVLLSTGSIFLVDGLGSESPVNPPSGPFPPDSATSDGAGSLYIATHTSTNHEMLVKLNSAVVVSTFSLDAYGKPSAIAVDSTGAVYVAGTPVAGFEATPGAYQTVVPKSTYSVKEGYVLKIAATLDSVAYATLLYQGQDDGHRSPIAIAVDSGGNAYIGGEFDPSPDQLFPATQIGLPRPDVNSNAYVLKLNPSGTGLVWADAFGPGSVDALNVLPDGRVRALVALFPLLSIYGMGPQVDLAEVLFAISSDGANVENSYSIGGIQPNVPQGFMAAAPGGPAPIRVFVSTSSQRFPVIFNDQPTKPLLINFSEPPQADLSVSASLAKPFVTGGAVNTRVIVSNNGPGDAEGVQLRAHVTNSSNSAVFVRECYPGGVAICNAGGGAFIPKLSAGASIEIDFVHGYGCVQDPCPPMFYASVQALTADPNLANNIVMLKPPVTDGFDLQIASHGPPASNALAYYRSDLPGSVGSDPTPSADPALVVAVPIQTAAGNVWYFDSWGDGNRDNPRTFDASHGVPTSTGRISFRTALPFGIDPGSLDLVALPGSNPLPQSLRLYPSLFPGKWSIGKPVASWLSVGLVENKDNIGSAVVTGSADVAGLDPGYYRTTFSVKLVVPGNPDLSFDIPTTLRILDKMPVIQESGFVNGASYQIGPLTSNEIVTIFGKGLGPPQLVTAYVPQAGSLPLSLAGTSVEFDGFQAQLLYVQDQSIAAIVPSTVYQSEKMTIKLGGAIVASLTIPTAPYGPGLNGTSYAPALFTSDSSGVGGLAAVNADGTVNSPVSPAKKGSLVTLYGTGFPTACGENNFAPFSPQSTLFPTSTSPVEAFVGGRPAYVVYSGTAPETTCGAQQFDVVIPEDSATGSAVPVRLGIPAPGSSSTDPYVWYSTQSGTTLAIQ